MSVMFQSYGEIDRAEEVFSYVAAGNNRDGLALRGLGNLAMPPLFGLLANNITPALFPFYLLALLVLMVFMHEQLVRKTSRC